MLINLFSAFLMTISLLLVGCGSASTPAAPVRLAKPVIVNQHIKSVWFIPIELEREIRNDGPSGAGHVEVYSVQDIGGHDTHGESGAEKVLRETFTRSLEPEPVSHPNILRTPHAVENALFQASETRTLTIPIQQYHPSIFSNEQLKIEATGISVISPPL